MPGRAECSEKREKQYKPCGDEELRSQQELKEGQSGQTLVNWRRVRDPSGEMDGAAVGTWEAT